MSRGQPDFGATQAKSTGASLSDMAELAARLGSIVTFDRRGDVIDFDDFEGATINWGRHEAIGVATGLHDFTLPKRGSQCIKLTTVNDPGDAKGIGKGLSLLPSGRIGAEISFAQPNDNIIFIMRFNWFNGITVRQSALKLDFTAKTLSYYDSDAAYQVIASDLTFISKEQVYYTIKLVVDYDTGKYVRAILADTEYDLSDYAIRSAASATLPYIGSVFFIYRKASTNGSLWLDQYILTQNEP
ncbi:hypothetical protein LCGC14_1893670 [marine sediment metagenome]|uniref:Uncharacterized protein n=1 Tax=marine sediment metagenome TaxID=412755 RepID=A0A0F9IWT1_9ZZZZ